MSEPNSGRNSQLDESHRMLIDTTQGANMDEVRAKLLSEGAVRPKILSANGDTDEFQMSGKGGPSEREEVKLAVRMQAAGVPPKDSFQSGSQLPSQRSGVRHMGNASDIADSDSELEVGVPEIHRFEQVHPERTYGTFEEADAAADAQASAAYLSADVTRKSAFKGGASSKPADNFARVTWTDLSMGKAAAFQGKTSSRAGSRSGTRAAGGGMLVNRDVASFSLANQERHGDVEEIKSE